MILDDVYDVVLNSWPTDAGAWMLHEAEKDNGNWKHILDQARSHNSGDTLLDFVVMELHETMTGDRDPVATGVAALEDAVSNIETVIAAIRNAEIA